MGFSFRSFFQGLRIVPRTTSDADSKGDLEVIDSTGKLQYHNGLSLSSIVTEDHSATLTNKSIDGNDNTLTNIPYSALPANIATTDTTQTFTNKSIDADANTITNIDDGNIKSGANIDRIKLASGNGYRILANNASGVMSENAALTTNAAAITDSNGQLSSEAALSPVRGGTGISNNAAATLTRSGNHNLTITTSGISSITVPTSGTLSTLAGVETLSNKTFSDPLTLAHNTTPSAPSSGFEKLWIDSSHNLNWTDSLSVTRTAALSTGNDFRNFVHNGAFDFSQRQTSQSSIGLGQTFIVDRFSLIKIDTTSIHAMGQSSESPTLTQSGFASNNALSVQCTTADASVGVTDAVYFQTVLEGYDWAELKNKQVTLSFWIKHGLTGTYCVSFTNNANDRSYVAEYTINAPDTWEKKTITLTLNPSGGTDNFSTGAGLRIRWALMAGSTFQTTANAWQTSSGTGYLATSNQSNGCSTTVNNIFRITQIMLNIGPTAQNFNRAGNSIQGELALCQRYYEKSYQLSQFPGTDSTSIGSRAFARGNGSAIHASSFLVAKRIPPSGVGSRFDANYMTIFSTNNNNAQEVRNANTSANIGATVINQSEFSFQVSITGASSASDTLVYQFAASCDF